MRSSRRDLLFAAPGAIAAAMVSGSSSARAAAPIARLAGSHMKLSLAAYSFDRYLIKRGTPEQVAAAKMTIEQFIDYCGNKSRWNGTDELLFSDRHSAGIPRESEGALLSIGTGYFRNRYWERFLFAGRSQAKSEFNDVPGMD